MIDTLVPSLHSEIKRRSKPLSPARHHRWCHVLLWADRSRVRLTHQFSPSSGNLFWVKRKLPRIEGLASPGERAIPAGSQVARSLRFFFLYFIKHVIGEFGSEPDIQGTDKAGEQFLL